MTSSAHEKDSEWNWPEALDGPTAAPEAHRMILESKGVRVLEVIVRSGQREPEHTHRNPSVLIVDRSARLRYYDADGNVTEIPAATSPYPKAQLMTPESLHAVENIDDHDYHAFRVELIDSP